MDEMVELYYNLTNTLPNIYDGSVILNADVTMSRIEDLHHELLNDAADYVECFHASSDSTFNICVYGADGHPIVSVIRRSFPNATVIWAPNSQTLDESYYGKMHGMILSPITSRGLLDNCCNLSLLSTMIIDNGFLLFDIIHERKPTDYFNLINSNRFVPVKLFKNRLFYILKTTSDKESAMNSYQINKSDFICKYDKVFCVCPSQVKSGGPELMHQLTACINSHGGQADIAYINSQDAGGWAVPELADYVPGHVTTFEKIDDNNTTAVVIPEGWPYAVNNVKNAHIFFWWLSVDNYISVFSTQYEAQKYLEYLDNRVYLHLVQSEYARRFLMSNGIHESKIRYLSDYINRVYLENNGQIDKIKREDIVLYNPKKGKEYVECLIKKAPDIKWTAIENMSTSQVRKLMEKSKIYIDFGNHPGKDRIPREAAMCGCIVITGRQGSAAYHKDVPIPEKFKLDSNNLSYEYVVNIIRESIINYSELIEEYSEYRKIILSEENSFSNNVKTIFFEEKYI